MADEITTGEADGDGRIDSIEALSRLGAGAWWRTARWSVGASLKIGSRLVGVVDPEHRVAGVVSELLGDPDWLGATKPTPPPTLRERGQLLLTESADVHYEQGSHPAYARILADLAPDEARILRLIYQHGPQPAVDVRAGFAFVPGSRLVAQGYSMVGAEAGCRFVDQVPAYLSNLNRLGLVWFSREPVRDRERYQVLEVQPEVSEALKRAGRFSHVVRRSLQMTPLGEDFCEVALPLDTAEFAALDRAAVPDRSARIPSPE